MMFGKPFTIALCTSLFVISASCYRPRHTIHKMMTAPELGYYFGASNNAEVPEYQIVYMPVLMPRSAQRTMGEEHEDTPLDYKFNAFGRDVALELVPNVNLVAPNFKVRRTEGDYDEILEMDDNFDCHYLHKGVDSVAAISMCQDRIIHGLVFMDNATYEIRPLTPRLRSLVRLEEALLDEDESANAIPHIIHKANVNLEQLANDYRVLPEEDDDSFDEEISALEDFRYKRKSSKYTVEVAVFFDEEAYRLFAPYLNNDEKEIRDMLLAYMNGVQALYHHPSLGTSVELTIVRMDLMKVQPSDMPHYNGERSQLLDSFCDYQQKLNPKGDSNPEHWDMGLYVSGLDFYAIENGRKSGVTMGLATVGGVCMDKYACVISELGTTNVFGKPYPSAGFTSVYILAHEIGHNLGMHHDSSGNSCSKEGYIMSPSRGTNGETIWSPCSATVMSKLDTYTCLLDQPGTVTSDRNHERFQDTPGQTWTAKRQCEFLLRDKDAHVSLAGGTLANICQQLQCKTPHRSGFYFAGPALEGTDCGQGMWCQGGGCVKMEKKKPNTVQGGWGKWKYSECSSGCLINGKGFLTKERVCDNPTPKNTDEGCEGISYEINICKDEKFCRKTKRKHVDDYASHKCKEFSTRLPQLDPKGSGLQAPHEQSRLWMACAIFCRRADSGGYYTPRIDLNDLGVNPYFPDGTWCHTDGKENYYCLQHHCLPESFKFSKLWGSMGDDIHLPGNAHPYDVTLPPMIQKYLSLGPDGKPLLTNLGPEHSIHSYNDDWTNHDYMELPASLKNIDSNDSDELSM